MKLIKLTFFIPFMLIAPFFGLAQNTRNVEAPTPPKPMYQSAKKEKKGLFAFLKKDKRKTNTTEVEAFRARLNDVYKERAKSEYKADKIEKRQAKKGENFFGHKRPPKKRPAGKQKFCKVCQLRH